MISQEIWKLRGLGNKLGHLGVFRIQYTKRVGTQAPLTVFIKLIFVRLKVLDQSLAMLCTVFRHPQRIKLQPGLKLRRKSQLFPETGHHDNLLGIGLGLIKPKGLDTKLMKLAVPTLLRAFVPKHGPEIPESAWAVIQKVMLDHRPHHGRSILGSKRKGLAIKRIVKAVHFFFNNVGDLADGTHKNRG